MPWLQQKAGKAHHEYLPPETPTSGQETTAPGFLSSRSSTTGSCCRPIRLSPRTSFPARCTSPARRPAGWFLKGQADNSLEGFSTDISVDVGQTISFKVTDTTLDPYAIDIYRIGYYGGDGARLVTTIPSSQIYEPAGPDPQRRDRRG